MRQDKNSLSWNSQPCTHLVTTKKTAFVKEQTKVLLGYSNSTVLWYHTVKRKASGTGCRPLWGTLCTTPHLQVAGDAAHAALRVWQARAGRNVFTTQPPLRCTDEWCRPGKADGVSGRLRGKGLHGIPFQNELSKLLYPQNKSVKIIHDYFKALNLTSEADCLYTL